MSRNRLVFWGIGLLVVILAGFTIGMNNNMTKASNKNRLVNASSPYLQAHADNPVDWYEWSDEAFEKAKEEDKPIFLSIGYNACHWCHVMEHESFENEEIAMILNTNFISIKVDREERPDIDDIYMSAVTSMTGGGGWPMTIFMTWDKKPFYSGTYFPPQSRYGRPGFQDIIVEIAKAYKTRKDEIFQSAETIASRIAQQADLLITARPIDKDVMISGAKIIYSQVDLEHGGFGGSPKFPQSARISYLFRAFLLSGDEKYLKAGLLTLDKMSEGGIYDQLEGGFHRYATDARWLVPHFEKMLYDNALLVIPYIEAYQLSGNEEYLKTVNETLTFIQNRMTHQDGGFYSTIDADSDGEEGKYYIWTRDQIQNILGRDAGWYEKYYGVTEKGNFEDGFNILHRGEFSRQAVNQTGLSKDEFQARLYRANQKLLMARTERIAPMIDDKILASWNGLAISAFAQAYQVTGNNDYIKSAVEASEFVLDNMIQDGVLFHSFREGKLLKIELLEDYAYFISAMIDLYQASFDERYLELSKELADRAIKQFYTDGKFYQSVAEDTDLIFRPYDPTDGATPSPASVMIMNIQWLARVTEQQKYASVSKEALANVSGLASSIPQASATLLMAGYFDASESVEVVIVGENSDKMREFNKEIFSRFIPNRIVVGNINGNNSNIPLLQGRQGTTEPTYYFCRNQTCRLPVTNFDELKAELDWVAGSVN